MMIDFALEAERTARQAAARGDLRGLPAALPADHDDHDGRAARARCRWRWARGIGSELRRPLGITIIGGLIFSQCSRSTRRRSFIWPSTDWRAVSAVGPPTARDPRRPSSRWRRTDMSLSTPFIHRPVGTTLLTVAITLAGALGYLLLPVSPLPQVDFPTISGLGLAARRQPRDDGLGGRHAAGAAVRADRRHHGDDARPATWARRRSRCSSI